MWFRLWFQLTAVTDSVCHRRRTAEVTLDWLAMRRPRSEDVGTAIVLLLLIPGCLVIAVVWLALQVAIGVDEVRQRLLR